MLKMFQKSEKKTSVSEVEKGHTYRMWLVAILANTTLINYGFQAGWVSPMTKILQSEDSPTGQPLTDAEISWIASIICLVAATGVPLYSYIADTYGRRVGIIAIAVPQALCWLIKLSSANIAVLMVARAFCGLAAGGCFNVIPIYVKEISRDDIRGLTGSLLMVAFNLGMLGIYAIGAYLDYYKILFIVMSWPIFSAVLMMKAPESPSFLVKVGKTQEALATVAWLRGLAVDHPAVVSDISTITNDKLFYDALPSISMVGILKNKAWRRSMLLMAGFMTINALNGCFAILVYAASILEASGVTFSAEVQSMSFPALMIVSGLLSMACVERFGRKLLIAVTLLLICGSMFGLGAVVLLQHLDYSVPGFWPATLMVAAVASYAAGVGPVAYIVMTEMFNFQIRAKVIGSIVSLSWFFNFVQLLAYAPLSSALGTHNTFFCFGAISLAGFFLVLTLLPETKGKTVEEIEAKFKGK